MEPEPITEVRVYAKGIPEHCDAMEHVARAFGFQSARHMREVTEAADRSRGQRARRAREAAAAAIAKAEREREHEELKARALQMADQRARERDAERNSVAARRAARIAS